MDLSSGILYFMGNYSGKTMTLHLHSVALLTTFLYWLELAVIGLVVV